MIYCMADLHGERDFFLRMLEQIRFSPADHLYILGDVIDRGPSGVELLEQIMEAPNMTMLLGNHEQMCLSTLGPRNELGARDVWRQNGGMATYRQLLYHCTPQRRNRILRFLSGLPDHLDLTVGGQNFHLVHGFPGADHHTRIWGRVESGSASPYPDTVCIVGHTPTAFLTGRMDEDCSIWHGDGIIDIDCGCGSQNAPHRRLACLQLDDMAEFYVGGTGDAVSRLSTSAGGAFMNGYDQAVKKWQAWKVQTTADLALRLADFSVLFAYHSGKIENDEISYQDTREIFENGKAAGYTGSTRTLLEQQNQKTCHALLQSKIVAREPLSLHLIRTVHRVLTEGTYDERRYAVNGERPGEFKKHDYVTGINEAGSPPDEVEGDLAELIDEVNALGQKAPLKAVAYFHARFENIHPFADGNGRVGRTLLNYWLLINDYPPIIIYEEDRRAYYDALQAYDEQEDLDPLIKFLQRETIKTWRQAMELSGGNAS